MRQDNEVVIRPIEKQDLVRLWELIYRDATPEWKQWDAPYFEHKAMSYEEFQQIEQSLIQKKTCGSLRSMEPYMGPFLTISKMPDENGSRWASSCISPTAGIEVSGRVPFAYGPSIYLRRYPLAVSA